MSPRLAARLDFNKYRSGVETCENLIPLSEGGAMRRSGTRYIAEEKSSTVKGRLKRFRFSTTQAYAVEMGNQSMRFYRHQAQIAVADTDAVITNGLFTSNITDWDDRSTGGGSITQDSTNGRLNLLPGGTATTDIGWAEQDVVVTSLNQEHVIKFRVLGAPGDKIEFQVGTTSTGAETLAAVEKEVGWHCVAFTPTASPFYVQFRNLGSFRNKTVQIDDVSLIDNSAVEIDSPWTEPQLFDVEGPQTTDELYLFHDSVPTHKLQRFGHTTWSLVEVPWADGPYLDENTTTTTLFPLANTGFGINLTLSSTVGVNGGKGWLSTDIGRLVRYKKSTTWGYAVIVSITSTIVAVADVRKDFETTPTAVTTWRLGAWSDTTGYARAASFFEQRLYTAGTNSQPQTFWGSQTADFQNFKPDDDTGTIEADDALNFTLSADDVNAIRWMSAGEDTLVIGTSGGEWIPESTGEVITPLDITVRRQTKYGSARVQPVLVGNAVLFVQFAKRKIREFGFVEVIQGFKAPDMTRLASHIAKGGIVEMDYAEEAESIVWAVRNDGQLLSMTFKRDEDVVGWARHIIGGRFLDDNSQFARVWSVDASEETTQGVSVDTDWRSLAVFASIPRYGEQPNQEGEWKDQTGLSPVQGDPTDASLVAKPFAAAEHTGNWNPSKTQYLQATNMLGDAVPGDALITGIKTRMLATKTSLQTIRSKKDEMRLVQDGAIGGANRGSAGTVGWPAPASSGTPPAASEAKLIEFGIGDADLWGRSWTPAQINSSLFGWVLSSIEFTFFSEYVLVDHMEIKVFYTFTAFIDETINANNTTNADWRLFPPDGTVAVGDYAAFGFGVTFGQLKFDYANGTAGIGGAVAWEYWDGSAWAGLPDVVDNTASFTATAADGLTVTWTIPTDWQKKTINSAPALFYVRARITSPYATSPVLDQGFVQGTGGAAVESVAVIPGADGAGQVKDSSERDEVWITVKRTINGATKRYVEVFELDFETGDDQEDAYYADSLISYDDVLASALAGYDHLEGETVKIWADGAIQSPKKVSSGSIPLDTPASVAQVGLGYKHKLKILKVSAGNPAGTPLGKTKRIYGVTFALLNSHTLSFGPNSENLTEQDFRVVSDAMDTGASLFTGEKFAAFEGDWTGDARIVIESDDPAPFTLLAIAPEIQVNPLK